MSQNNSGQPNNDYQNPGQNNGEIDIISIFEYFKNGIKSIFRFFGNIVKSFLWFLVVIKRNIILFAAIIIATVILGFLYNIYADYKDKHQYEMVIKSDKYTIYDLYALVSQLNNSTDKESRIHKQLGLTPDEITAIRLFEIEPVINTNDIVTSYYSQFDDNKLFRETNMDTVFYKEFEIKDYKETLTEQDHPVQKLTIKTNGTIDPYKFQENLIKYFEENPFIKSRKNQEVIAYDSAIVKLRKDLSIIDSILIGRARGYQRGLTGEANDFNISAESRGRTNLETDLIRENMRASGFLFSAIKQREEAKYAIVPISGLQEVSQTSVLSGGLIKFFFIGLVFAIITILLLQLNKYLDKMSAKQTQ